MSPTQISPGTSGPPPTLKPRPDGGDIFDAARWETVYREAHDYPNLVLLLQDDLTRSRKKEAFWISVVVHLVLVILIVNSTRLLQLLPRSSVVMVNPNDLSRQKDLTYLELPPDAEKITKRPDTDKISDKNRTAQSKAPQIDRDELKKIIGSSHPGPLAPPNPGPQSPTPPAAQAAPAPQQPAPARQDQSQTAKLQSPPVQPAKPNFNTDMSAGSAIEQAARAALANRGGYAGGDGNYGLGQGRQPKGALGPMEILSDTQGVDFGPYLQRVLHDVKENWYRIIPESAVMKKGKVTIEFAILKDGSVAGLKVVSTSGDVSLDRAAWGGISASNPFPPLPGEFTGQYLALRFRFFYNPGPGDMD